MSVQITYFVHGTTTDNENDIATGWAPGVLSVLGKKQAAELRELTKNKTFDVVFCSDSRRAVDSARLAFGGRYEIIQDKRLREVDYGRLTQATVQEVRQDLEKRFTDPYPDGESYTDVENRIKDFCDFLKKEYDGKHVAVVAHQGPQHSLEVLLNGKTWKQAFDEDWRRTGVWQPGWNYTIK